eukprot:767614-Hanusia_phi.AAC.2
MERVVAKIFDTKSKARRKSAEPQGKYSLRQMLKEERAAQGVIRKSGLGEVDDSKASEGDALGDGISEHEKRAKALQDENIILREQLKLMAKVLQGEEYRNEDVNVRAVPEMHLTNRESSIESVQDGEGHGAANPLKRRRPSHDVQQQVVDNTPKSKFAETSEHKTSDSLVSLRQLCFDPGSDEKQTGITVLPGVSEMWTAKLAAKLKIPAIVFSESSACLRFGLPHSSLVSWSDYKTALAEICPAFPLKQASSSNLSDMLTLPQVFADHPHCFDTRREAIYYIQLLESMGVGAVILGDRSKSFAEEDVVETDDFFACLKSAVNARTNDEMLIFARTSMSIADSAGGPAIVEMERDIARRLEGAMACGIDGVVLDCWRIHPESIELLKRIKLRLGENAGAVLYLHPQRDDDWKKFGGKLKKALQGMGFRVILRPDDLHLTVASAILNKLRSMTAEFSDCESRSKQADINFASSLTSSQDINDLVQTQHLSQLEVEIM